MFNKEELQLILSALRYTTENGYCDAQEMADQGQQEALTEYLSMHKIIDKIFFEITGV